MELRNKTPMYQVLTIWRLRNICSRVDAVASSHYVCENYTNDPKILWLSACRLPLSKSESTKTLFKVGHFKQYLISSHLKWVLVAHKEHCSPLSFSLEAVGWHFMRTLFSYIFTEKASKWFFASEMKVLYDNDGRNKYHLTKNWLGRGYVSASHPKSYCFSFY